jgi:catalase
VSVMNNNQDGLMNMGDRKGEVNYEPSTMREIAQDPQYKLTRTPLSGTAQQEAVHKTLDFRQAGEFYRSLSEQDKQELITALSGDLGQVTNDTNKYTMLSYFYKADADYGTRLANAVHANVQQVQSQAAKLSDTVETGQNKR